MRQACARGSRSGPEPRRYLNERWLYGRAEGDSLDCWGRHGRSGNAAPAEERIELLDALRGFALFGILLANIFYWSGWVLVTDAERQMMATPDE